MAQWILKANVRAIPLITTLPLRVDEIHSATELNNHEKFYGLIERRWSTSINPPMSSTKSYK